MYKVLYECSIVIVYQKIIIKFYVFFNNSNIPNFANTSSYHILRLIKQYKIQA